MPGISVLDSRSMRDALSILGYDRVRKCVYRAKWSTLEVEHFVFFSLDPRQYFVAEFGIRNPVAEQFGVASMIKYGHPNFQLWVSDQDPATCCCMRFNFRSLEIDRRLQWPRVRLPAVNGDDLAALTVGFIHSNVLPSIGIIRDIEAYREFLVNDRQPNWWRAAPNLMIRVAQIVAVHAQIGRNKIETRELLKPYDREIEKDLRNISMENIVDVSMYLNMLFSDWASHTHSLAGC